MGDFNKILKQTNQTSCTVIDGSFLFYILWWGMEKKESELDFGGYTTVFFFWFQRQSHLDLLILS